MLLADGPTALLPAGLLGAAVLVLVISVAGVYLARRVTGRFLRVPPGWVRAGGVVVEQQVTVEHEHLGTGVSRLERPVVEFAGPDGATVRFASPVAANLMPRRGTAVVVYHDPLRPQRAMIAPESLPRINATAARIVPVFFGVIGTVLALLLAGAGVLLLLLT